MDEITAERIARLDWKTVYDSLDERGVARLSGVLSQKECEEVQGWYAEPERFRSRVVMARHGFGTGEYQYFDYPLPPIVSALREAAYSALGPIATRWNHKLRISGSYPKMLSEFTAICHANGQTKPTPLLLKYGAGDYNRLHQDLYGYLYFPMQMVLLLSKPGHDFTGGEFVLTEQKPHTQSRVEVVPLGQGDACIFAVNARPACSAKGYHKVTMRHGVSTVRKGERYTLGIIFHDAQ